MSKYDLLIEEASAYGLQVIERDFKSKAQGLIKGSKIGIRKDMPTIQKACALAEEIAHYLTSVGNILDQSDVVNRKQELRARQWAYECMIPYEQIVQAHIAHISGRYELADFLEVSEDFLESAIERYTSKYGLYLKVNEQFTIRFDPLVVIELFTDN
jgi:hypothetical protein